MTPSIGSTGHASQIPKSNSPQSNAISNPKIPHDLDERATRLYDTLLPKVDDYLDRLDDADGNRRAQRPTIQSYSREEVRARMARHQEETRGGASAAEEDTDADTDRYLSDGEPYESDTEYESDGSGIESDSDVSAIESEAIIASDLKALHNFPVLLHELDDVLFKAFTIQHSDSNGRKGLKEAQKLASEKAKSVSINILKFLIFIHQQKLPPQKKFQQLQKVAIQLKAGYKEKYGKALPAPIQTLIKQEQDIIHRLMTAIEAIDNDSNASSDDQPYFQDVGIESFVRELLILPQQSSSSGSKTASLNAGAAVEGESGEGRYAGEVRPQTHSSQAGARSSQAGDHSSHAEAQQHQLFNRPAGANGRLGPQATGPNDSPSGRPVGINGRGEGVGAAGESKVSPDEGASVRSVRTDDRSKAEPFGNIRRKRQAEKQDMLMKSRRQELAGIETTAAQKRAELTGFGTSRLTNFSDAFLEGDVDELEENSRASMTSLRSNRARITSFNPDIHFKRLLQLLVLKQHKPQSFSDHLEGEAALNEVRDGLLTCNDAQGKSMTPEELDRLIGEMENAVKEMLKNKSHVELADKICTYLTVVIHRKPVTIGSENDFVTYEQAEASHKYNNGVWLQETEPTPSEVVQKAGPEETLGNFFAIRGSDGKFSLRSNNLGSEEKCVTLAGSFAAELVKGKSWRQIQALTKKTHDLVSISALDRTAVKGMAGGKSADELRMFKAADKYLKSKGSKAQPYVVEVKVDVGGGRVETRQVTLKVRHRMLNKPMSDFRTAKQGVFGAKWSKVVQYNRPKYQAYGKMLGKTLDKRHKTSGQNDDSPPIEVARLRTSKATPKRLAKYHAAKQDLASSTSFQEFVENLDALYKVKHKMKTGMGLFKKSRDKLENDFKEIVRLVSGKFMGKCSTGSEKNALVAVVQGLTNGYAVSHDGKNILKLRHKMGYNREAPFGALSTICDHALFREIDVTVHDFCKSGEDRTVELKALEKTQDYFRSIGIDLDVVGLLCTRIEENRDLMDSYNNYLLGTATKDRIQPKNQREWLFLIVVIQYNRYKEMLADPVHNVARKKGKKLKTQKHPIDQYLGLRHKDSKIGHIPRLASAKIPKKQAAQAKNRGVVVPQTALSKNQKRYQKNIGDLWEVAWQHTPTYFTDTVLGQ